MAKATPITVEGNVLFPKCCPACMVTDPDSNILLEHRAINAENAVTLFSGRVAYNVTIARVPYCKACSDKWKLARWVGNVALYGGLFGTFLSTALMVVGVPIGILLLIWARKYDVIRLINADRDKKTMTFLVKNNAYAKAMMQVNTLSKPKEPAQMRELVRAG